MCFLALMGSGGSVSDLQLSSSSGCAKAGGVRFSEKPPASGAPSHVHFDEKLHDSVVMVTPEDDGNFMVKVCLTLESLDKHFYIPFILFYYFSIIYDRFHSVKTMFL